VFRFALARPSAWSLPPIERLDDPHDAHLLLLVEALVDRGRVKPARQTRGSCISISTPALSSMFRA
jgi:hypothetical protein